MAAARPAQDITFIVPGQRRGGAPGCESSAAPLEPGLQGRVKDTVQVGARCAGGDEVCPCCPTADSKTCCPIAGGQPTDVNPSNQPRRAQSAAIRWLMHTSKAQTHKQRTSHVLAA